MENSYFIYSNTNEDVVINRFHICTWEFKNNTSFIEFGCELDKASIKEENELKLQLFVPWINADCVAVDFYGKLKGPENSRFIFNDSIQETKSLDGGQNLNGVIHTFSDRNTMCILPVVLGIDSTKKIATIVTSLRFYNKVPKENRPNIYLRFSLTPKKKLIADRKKGITKSTILYDTRVNQKRNLPEFLIKDFVDKRLCKITSCFCFHIIPNSYDLTFFDSTSLKNVRMLESESFKKYLPDKPIKDNELIVVYNRKDGSEAFNFFSIFTKEYIGVDQLAIGILISLVSGVLLFVDSYKVSYDKSMSYSKLWCHMPLLFWIVVGLIVALLVYMGWKKIKK